MFQFNSDVTIQIRFLAQALCSKILILGVSGTENFRWQPCGYWNPAECTCNAGNAACPDGYTMSSDAVACYILRYILNLNLVWASVSYLAMWQKRN